MGTFEATEAEENFKAVTAMSYLLTLVTPHVPQAVLQQQFERATTVLLRVLAAVPSDAHGTQAVLKSLLSCQSMLLTAQNPATWEKNKAIDVLTIILRFTVDSRAKVRKTAQQSVTALVARVSKGGDHPAIRTTVECCIRHLRQEEVVQLYTLNLLTEILCFFTPAGGKTVCEHILKLLTHGSHVMNSACMVVLRALFSAMTIPLTAGQLAQLLSALHECEPALTEVAPRMTWNSVLTQGYIALSTRDASTCGGMLAAMVSTLIEGYVTDQHQVARNITDSLLVSWLWSGGLGGERRGGAMRLWWCCWRRTGLARPAVN